MAELKRKRRGTFDGRTIELRRRSTSLKSVFGFKSKLASEAMPRQ